jgi:hypothetical protein
MISELFVIYIQQALIHPISIEAHPPSDLQPVDAPDLQFGNGVVRAMNFYSFYSRLPHPQISASGSGFSMHSPQWNNTRIILADDRYPVIDAFYLVGRVATERRTWISCRLIWLRSTGKGTVTCSLLWMMSMDTSSRLPGSKVWRYW